MPSPRRPRARDTLVGTRVEVKRGFLWLRRGVGTVRSTYTKAGREFATVELDGSGEVVLRLVKTLRPAGS
ncbi:MAG TPA: hypothetical protein PLL32_02370 [Anaeromyxobacteraceae bacterium]|nr:hypothetical protein [Anaeromyxobacteraceae bacterium]